MFKTLKDRRTVQELRKKGPQLKGRLGYTVNKTNIENSCRKITWDVNGGR